jgi:CDP-glucose 4,6-dehydratase
MVNETVWRGKKVFLTGHTGFKGSWLSLWLQMMGARVCGYSLDPPTEPNLFTCAGIANGMESIIADVRDFKSLDVAIQEFAPDVVMHMAAQSLVRESYDNPVATYETNVMGTVNLLESIRKTKSVTATIIVTSDKCYENEEWSWGYREIDKLGGHDPYSNSKGCAEMVTSAYHSSFFSTDTRRMGLATVRAGNVIGGGDWATDRLIPDLIRAFSDRKKAVIRNPDAIRPWQHVLEPLSGYLMLTEKLMEASESSGAWNFGPGYNDTESVGSVVNKLSDIWGDQAQWITDTASHPHEATLLQLDCNKAHSLLGWAPNLNLNTALEMTVNWYKAYSANEDMNQFTRKQIHQFTNQELR